MEFPTHTGLSTGIVITLVSLGKQYRSLFIGAAFLSQTEDTISQQTSSLLTSHVCCCLAETQCYTFTTKLTSVLSSELCSSSSVQEEFRLAGVQAHRCSLRAQSPSVQSSLGAQLGLSSCYEPQNHIHQISIYFSPCPKPWVTFCTVLGKADVAKAPPFPDFLALKGQCVFFIWESEINFLRVFARQ